MNKHKHSVLLAAVALVCVGVVFARLSAEPAADSVAGETDRSALPIPDPPFEGTIGETYEDSTPDFPSTVKAPADAPNVLIILLDDVGFGMASTFGGPVPTPTLDRLAENGLRYNRFHTTALCSPTRAALLTGRNHHSCGTGVIIEMGTGYPGYTGIIPRSTALVSETLAANGYSTAMFGKWHNTPENDISPAGPFDRWPTGLGFDYFYGFNQGETNQFYPVLYQNTTAIDPPSSPEEGYHFTTDMTDQTISWIHNVDAAAPDRPWFVYYSTGAIHAPHQPPAEWREKFAGQFDQGWDALREETWQRQLAMGVIPAGTQLTPRPEEIPAWDDQSDDAKRVYCRLMENYAGFMAHTDYEVGRLVDDLEATGELENTLIFYIVGDNGASAEGGLEGTFCEVASLFGVQLGLDSLLDRIDEIGSPESEPHVPVGFAWATDSPFQWTKQVASHFGGTRNAMVVHWPAGIQANGELCEQFHHVIDIAPTILEAAGIPEPAEVNGIAQKPIEGVSMLYTFDNPEAEDRRTTQYFEMMGNRAIYHDGWFACTRHGTPWITTGVDRGFDDDTWELYNIDEDFSQANNLAKENPEKLAVLQQLFLEEADRYGVLPLDDRMAQRMDSRNRQTGEPRTEWTYSGNDLRLPEPVSPQLFPNSFTISAQLETPEDGSEGVIACSGGATLGWTLYAQDGKLNYHYNYFDFEQYAVESDVELPAGEVTIGVEFVANEGGEGGTLTLSVNGEEVGSGELAKVVFRHGIEPFEIGRDSVSPVCHDYAEEGSFPFNGTIRQIEFQATQ